VSDCQSSNPSHDDDDDDDDDNNNNVTLIINSDIIYYLTTLCQDFELWSVLHSVFLVTRMR